MKALTYPMIVFVYTAIEFLLLFRFLWWNNGFANMNNYSSFQSLFNYHTNWIRSVNCSVLLTIFQNQLKVNPEIVWMSDFYQPIFFE